MSHSNLWQCRFIGDGFSKVFNVIGVKHEVNYENEAHRIVFGDGHKIDYNLQMYLS